MSPIAASVSSHNSFIYFEKIYCNRRVNERSTILFHMKNWIFFLFITCSLFGDHSKAIFILGMHRSGTSAVTGVLNDLGVDFSSHLLPASSQNPKGYWEHTDVVAIQETFFNMLGRSWDDVRPLPEGWMEGTPAHLTKKGLTSIYERDFAGSSLWGIKDPRLCRLMPLWLPLLAEWKVDPYFILVIRPSEEVIKSLMHRDGMTRDQAQKLWVRYVLEAEKATRGYPRAIVHYRDLVEDQNGWYRVMSRLEKEWDIEWPIPYPVAAALISEFLTTELWHQRTELSSTKLEVAFANGDTPNLTRICDEIERELQQQTFQVDEGVDYALEGQYLYHCSQPSDINEHLPVLRQLAAECSSVADMNSGEMRSIWACLKGLSESSFTDRMYRAINPWMMPLKELRLAEQFSLAHNIDFEYWVAETKLEADLLLIDTLHTYCHLTHELERYSGSVNKYIVIHDTSDPWGQRNDANYRGDYSEYPAWISRKKKGLWPAVTDFLKRHPEWMLGHRYINNHGLTILKRVQQ